MPGRIARYQSNGVLDTSFDPGTGADGTILAVASQPDGTIVVAGSFTAFNGVSCSRIARLNSDGSLDGSFAPGAGANGTIHAVLVLSNGQIVIGGAFTSYAGVARSRIALLNADGTLDTAFANGPNGTVLSLALQSDGKLIVGGDFTTYAGIARARIARANANSTLDTTFAPGTGANAAVRVLRIQPDGNVLLAGSFTSYNGVTRGCIARVSSSGALDTTFANGANFSIHAMTLLSDGKIMIGGDFTTFAGFGRNRFARINANSTLDHTFAPGFGADSWIEDIAVLSNGSMLVGGNFTTLNASLRRYLARVEANGSVSSPDVGSTAGLRMIARQPDGKIVIAGGFTSVDGVARSRIARLNSDGSVDPSFDPGEGPDDWVHKFAIQSDGKIVIVGGFTNVNSLSRNRVARLNADGTLDESFNPGTGANNWTYEVAQQPDGKILIAGGFTSYNGSARNYIVRLNADGSLDNSFSIGTGANNYVYSLVLQPDGKVVIAGFFTTYAGTARTRIARLNTNGTLDTTFSPGLGANDAIYDVERVPSGGFLIGGLFGAYGGTTRTRVAKLTATGALDTSFVPGTGANDSVHDVVLQPDGKVLLGGDFTTFNGTARSKLARLNANGSLDGTFDVGTGANAYVYAIDLQPDGAVLFAGDFTHYDDTARLGYARLLGDACSADADGDGTADCSDGCPSDPSKIAPGICGCGIVDTDTDGDGAADCNDGCPLDPLKTALGACGCGVADTDSDGDSTLDCNDGCPSDPFKIAAGQCGCGYPDTDTDGDGTADCLESGALDLSFGVHPYDSFVSAPGAIRAAVRLSDGKFLVGGEFGAIRLTHAGMRDASFYSGTFNLATNGLPGVHAIAIQADGKIVLGGQFAGYSGVARPDLVRLNSDGTLDSSFIPAANVVRNIYAVVTQADGKLLVGGATVSSGGAFTNRVIRLNVDGSLDASFIASSGANGSVYAIAVQPDGKILIGGEFTAYAGVPINRMARLNSDGSLDSAFNVGTGAGGAVLAIALQPDGKVLLGGSFLSYNGIARSRIARLSPNGALDYSLFPCSSCFNPGGGANGTVRSIALQSDGRILLVGDFVSYDGVPRAGVVRIHSGGGLDTSFSPGLGANRAVRALALGVNGEMLIGGSFTTFNGATRIYIALLAANGGLDGPSSSFGPSALVIYAILRQSDDKLVLCGSFDSYAGVPRRNIARLNSDGSLDPNFIFAAGSTTWYIDAVAQQSDGKIVIGGVFPYPAAVGSYAGIVRLNSDGSVDPSLNSGSGFTGGLTGGNINCVSIMADGRILISGDFYYYNGTPRQRMARLHADGTLDASFNPGSGPDYIVTSHFVQPDGKILVAGYFTSFAGSPCRYIVRLHANGARDSSFDNNSLNYYVNSIALQADGKVVVGGAFASGVARLAAHGATDFGFFSGGMNATVHAMAIQPDGKVLIGGEFTNLNGGRRGRVARLNMDGSVDATFNANGVGADGPVVAMALMPDGKLVIGGAFATFNGIPSPGIARLNGDCSADIDGDGTADCADSCPNDPLKIAAGACGCGNPDTDTDVDGTPDCIDGCPLDPLKVAAGACGCGVADTDTDNDGTANCIDGCPADPLKTAAGICGCGVADTDTDNDGVANCIDDCPIDPLKTAAGICGCGVADTDADNDGVANCIDGCPSDPLKIAAGICGCGVADTDTDNDGAANCIDGCPNDPAKTSVGVCGCGILDEDVDLDGTMDCIDACPHDPLKIDPGACGCGLVDYDTDGDGVADCNDLCPNDAGKVDPGICGCGIADTDSDGDGVADCVDNCDLIPNGSQADCDLDGVGDACEILAGTQLDTNFNGTPDSCELGVVFNYCTAGTTTNGCTATIAAVGIPSASSGSGFHIVGTGIEGQKQALLYYGVSGPSGQAWAPGSTSYKCVRQPVQRCAPQSSGGVTNGCDGAYSLDLASYLATRPTAIGNPRYIGEVFNAQLWFRDPPAPSTSSLSNALQFTLAP
jgi:uncharacterized delta-60 repeat protein